MRTPMIILSLALALILAAAGVRAATETLSETPVVIHKTADIPKPEPSWYELSANDTVLTVRLDANPSTGYYWDFKISKPEILEFLTMEYVQDEAPAGMVGVGGTWVASFKSTFVQTGNTSLTLNYIAPDGKTIAETHTLNLKTALNYQISVVSEA